MARRGLLLKADRSEGEPDRSQELWSQGPFWQPEEFKFEDVERYCEGGYCPITLWQTLKDGRYRVVYKLGVGRFATVWLAQDLQETRHVALKISTADRFDDSLEIELLRTVTSGVPADPAYVISLLDAFDTTSANGNHRVLVMPVTCPSRSMRYETLPFRSVVKSLVKGLDNIHSTGIVHGDIHTDNIGYLYDLEELSDILPPECAMLPPVGGHRPPYMVSQEEWQEGPLWGETKNLKGLLIPIILDLGNASSASTHGRRGGDPKAIPRLYTPPEHIFTKDGAQHSGAAESKSLNHKTDIWALGASVCRRLPIVVRRRLTRLWIYELATAQTLIRQWGGSTKEQLLRIDNRLAPGWKAKSDPGSAEEPLESSQASRLSNDSVDGSVQSPVDHYWDRTIERLREVTMDIGDVQLFKSFLLDMVALDPDRRLSTRALLEHRYLADVPLCGGISF